jgi:hypothetical protein
MDNTIAYTLMPEPNQTYLAQTKNVGIPQDPLSGSTIGFMMVLSTFQYQSPTLNPTYSGALSQASKAAFIQSGGQQVQDKVTSVVTRDGIDFAHSIGLTDVEMGTVGLTYRTIQRRQLSFKGPKFGGVRSNFMVSPGNGTVGLTYGW